MAKTKMRRAGRTRQKVSRASKPRRRTAKAKLAARSQAQPERGKIHYLLRNIPKSDWTKFKATREDARFDLLTYIKSAIVPKPGNVEVELERTTPTPTEGYGATDRPTPTPAPATDPALGIPVGGEAVPDINF